MQKGAQQICQEDESLGSGLPPPCSLQSGELLEAIYFYYYLFSIFLRLVLTKLSQRSKPVCKGLHSRTCHFFWLRWRKRWCLPPTLDRAFWTRCFHILDCPAVCDSHTNQGVL